MFTEVGDHVITGMTPFVGDEADSVIHERDHALAGLGRVGVERGRVNPDPKPIPVAVRHAEELADDQSRQRPGEFRMQISGRTVIGQLVQQSPGQCLHFGL